MKTPKTIVLVFWNWYEKEVVLD